MTAEWQAWADRVGVVPWPQLEAAARTARGRFSRQLHTGCAGVPAGFWNERAAERRPFCERYSPALCRITSATTPGTLM